MRLIDVDTLKEYFFRPYSNEESYSNIDIAKIIDDTPTIQDEQWIPCSDGLPKAGSSVLVTYSDGEVDIIWSARPKAWVRYTKSNNLIYPIAWMPRPKPYKGGKKK